MNRQLAALIGDGLISAADFLTESSDCLEVGDLPTSDLSDHLERAVFFRHPSLPIADLEVWRALVPGLIPISFGWDLEPLGLPQVVDELGLTLRDLAAPLLPHPFS